MNDYTGVLGGFDFGEFKPIRVNIKGNIEELISNQTIFNIIKGKKWKKVE